MVRKFGLAVAWLLLGGSFLSFIAAVARDGQPPPPPVEEHPAPPEPEVKPPPPTEPVDPRWSRLSTPDPRVITALAISRDGALLAGGNTDGAVFVWNARGAVIGRLRGHSARITAIAFGDDGRTLASAASDDQVRVWDVTSNRTTRTIPFHGPRALAFSSDGAFLAVGGTERRISILDRAINVVDSIPVVRSCSALAFSPAAGRLASGSPSGEVHIWSMRERELFAECDGHDDDVCAIAWGASLVSADESGTPRVWHPHTGRQLTLTARRAVALSADAETFLHDEGDELVVSRKDLHWQLSRPGPVTTMALAGDGSVVAAACSDGTLWRRQLTK